MNDDLREALRGTDAEVTRSGTLLTFGEDDLEDRWDALGSWKARAIYRLLQAETLPPPDIADELDLSPQTVHYHLGRLVDAGLVSVVGQGYSEKGTEMDVYAADHDPLVVASTGGSGTEIRQQLSEYVTAGLAVALLAVLLGFTLDLGRVLGPPDPGGTRPEPVSAPLDGLTEPAIDAGLSLVPTLLFLAGGLTGLLILWGTRWYAGRSQAGRG